ncbi:MAG: 30S ribosomal protein S13 [Euryarchaeota archaeon]|nr:30S ribosomal protein S13 [Euryarchaeota archaeon]|tara:strand:+ start:24714 stop:25157 length:444 start_codon:yes stop_codon:yes gene_type:complete
MADEAKTIIRLLRKDVPGELTIETALTRVNGIGFSIASAVRLKLGLPRSIRLSELSDAQLKELNNILESTDTLNLPVWMRNRRKDNETGKDLHLLDTNLMFANRDDLIKYKKLKNYRGLRHMFGLKVRGQRTRSTGRKGTSMGVSKS